jgi:phosphonate transport system substrate-binding protein
VGVSIALMWFMGRNIGEHSKFKISNIIVESSTCSTDSTNNSATFIVFVAEQNLADLLLKMLCDNTVINRQFGKVEIRWSHKEQDIIQHVGKGIANLALVKENIMTAFATERTHGYEVVGYYQNYSAFLISLTEKPKIDKQYMWGKKMGLLDYPSSRSGHIIPKRMLNDLGLSDQNLKIIYANSHHGLRNLLSSGQVDVISSYWQEEDKLNFSENYITPIQDNVSGSKWYLKMPTQNTDLACGIQNTLLSLSIKMESDYYSQLIISDHCHPNTPEFKSDE